MSTKHQWELIQKVKEYEPFQKLSYEDIAILITLEDGVDELLWHLKDTQNIKKEITKYKENGNH